MSINYEDQFFFAFSITLIISNNLTVSKELSGKSSQSSLSHLKPSFLEAL